MKINLISGESYLLVNEKINDIVGLSKNVTTFDLAQSTLEDVLIEAGYVSMFEEEKFIVIKNANFFGTDKIKDSDTDILLNYFEHPSDNTNLIFICSTKLDLRKKITKIVKDKFNLINIPNLKYYEIENRAMEAFKKNGFKVEADTVKYLVQNSLNNFDLTMNEVDKIMLFYNESDYVKYEDVVNIAAKSINTNNFLFVDAVVDGDLEKSFELLNDLKIMKVEPTIILSLLARDFRIMLQIKTLQKEEKREYEILSKLGLQDWQLNKYLTKIFPFKIKELESILIKIADIDLSIKTGKVDKYTALELFILDICE
jgi:DNA polymerase-3 subunit delta